MMYAVRLSACGNPDHWEDPDDNIVNGVRVRSKVVKKRTIKECQLAVRRYIDDNMLGGGNWNGGEVYKDGVHIGYISYNGRFWEKDVFERM